MTLSRISAGPTANAERISALDALRGFAVLGILIMNIQSFSLPMAFYLNPMAGGPLSGIEWWVWFFSHLLADRKFITLFALLFGAGICLFAVRTEKRLGSSRRLHYRRMFGLMLIGLAHAYLLWYGDILFTYAICGMLVYPFRKMDPQKLLIVGLVVAAGGSSLFLFFGWSMPFWPPAQLAAMEQESWHPTPERLQAEMDTYRGSWLQQMQHRVRTSLFMETQFLLMYELWRCSGLMMVGMAFFKWGIFSAQRTAAFYWKFMAAGAFVGLPMVLYGVYRNVQAGWNIRYSFFFGPQWNYWGSILVCLMYIGGILLLCRRGVLRGPMVPLAAVGRMAFSNYLVQSLICTTLFYGHGFGLFGRVSRPGQLAVVASVWVLQLAVSPIWLRHFEFGPCEWLWRALTYGSRPPFRRTPYLPAPMPR